MCYLLLAWHVTFYMLGNCWFVDSFDDDSFVIKNKMSGQILENIHMTDKKMFPLDVSNVE